MRLLQIIFGRGGQGAQPPAPSPKPSPPTPYIILRKSRPKASISLKLKGGWEGSLRGGRGACGPPALPLYIKCISMLSKRTPLVYKGLRSGYWSRGSGGVPEGSPKALRLGSGVADRPSPGSLGPFLSWVATPACLQPEQSQGHISPHLQGREAQACS